MVSMHSLTDEQFKEYEESGMLPDNEGYDFVPEPIDDDVVLN